eukprot:1158178-Pelagomonas_calceolata.AAC.1
MVALSKAATIQVTLKAEAEMITRASKGRSAEYLCAGRHDHNVDGHLGCRVGYKASGVDNGRIQQE